jgi:FkbM family methyltransferase
MGVSEGVRMVATVRSALGLARSIAIYYGHPLRNRAQARFYARLLAPGDLVFDIGAHVGNRARALRAAGARVVAVEPQPLFARFLRRTLPADITVVEAALGARAARARMRVSRLHPTVSSLAPGFDAEAGALPGFERVAWDAGAEVAVTTLDALIARHGRPAFVKIDVEGHEHEVLAGLGEALPCLALEFLPGMVDRTLRAMDRLAELGDYRFNAVLGEEGAFLWSEWREGAAVAAWLATLAPGSASGDLYARRADVVAGGEATG